MRGIVVLVLAVRRRLSPYAVADNTRSCHRRSLGVDLAAIRRGQVQLERLGLKKLVRRHQRESENM